MKTQGQLRLRDAQKAKEVAAQVAITSEFGKQASKAVGDYAGAKLKEAQARGDQAGIEAWREGGSNRVALHAVVGGLTGGVQGALGAGAASAAAPAIEQLQAQLEKGLQNAGLGESASKVIASLAGGATAAGIGAAASGGSTAGGATAFNADMNNRQLHPTEAKLIKDNARRFARQVYGTDQPTAAQIEAAQALLANTAQNQLDNNPGVIVPSNAAANDFLQTLKIEYQQANGTLTLPGTTGQPTGAQQLFFANTEQMNRPWLNQGLADPAVTGLIVRTPINEASLPTASQGTITPAANGCVTAACAAGVLPERNAVRDVTDVRNDVADMAAGVSRGAGIVGSTATAATAIPGPHQPGAATTEIAATGVGLAADAVEQVARPDVGKTAHAVFLQTIVQRQLDNRLPLVAPITNEIIEIWKQSGTSQDLNTWANNEWKKFLDERAK